MRYTVVAETEARKQLTRLWTKSRSAQRREITRASAAIDVLLRCDPATKAKSQPEGLFIIDVPPLRAYFELSEPDRLVTITDYRWIS
jgi:hypothetical protein